MLKFYGDKKMERLQNTFNEIKIFSAKRKYVQFLKFLA